MSVSQRQCLIAQSIDFTEPAFDTADCRLLNDTQRPLHADLETATDSQSTFTGILQRDRTFALPLEDLCVPIIADICPLVGVRVRVMGYWLGLMFVS